MIIDGKPYLRTDRLSTGDRVVTNHGVRTVVMVKSPYDTVDNRTTVETPLGKSRKTVGVKIHMSEDSTLSQRFDKVSLSVELNSDNGSRSTMVAAANELWEIA